ncbi:FAD-dependent oxidoreductase [Pseudoalteromonas rubra]|uniref:D-amino-acid oxidase n=1 Tax=Pseudoalteromonas rubra TaxID=43658 RepID=A0A0U3GZH3_9GAMM|nr:FAD-dependent oxidoreductase [Pseudoalteromonas rubra]ALU45742.1 FAD-binding oxidoreductase [Pseudoalteromonas rubra]
MNRRELLQGAGSCLGLLGLTSCAGLSTAALRSGSRYADYQQVNATADSVLNTVVGLRPFRPAGYRLDKEMMGDKTLVHNYGHGGGGISLSWGTSHIAAELASQAKHKDIAILGSGVMGITTALLLAQKGFNVTLYADSFPPNTTSDIAAALWLPSSYFDRKLVSSEFIKQDRQIIRQAFKRFLPYINRPGYGVYWHNYHLLLNQQPKVSRALPGGDDLYPDLSSSTQDNLFGYPYQRFMRALMIDPMLYLPSLLRDAQMAGASLTQVRFDSLAHILTLKERVIVNCTGLGSKTLFGDDSMYPVQGQLTHLMPQPEVSYSYVVPAAEGWLYMFPRKGSIVIGGTAVKGAYSTIPNTQLTQDMLTGHARLADKLVLK